MNVQIIFLTTTTFILKLYTAKAILIQNDEIKLRQYLFENDTKDVRPVSNYTKRMLLTMDVEFLKVISVDERKQLIKLKLWLRMNWTNELLTWDTQEWGGIDVLKVDPTLVWKPDIILYNNCNSESRDTTDHQRDLLHLNSDGHCYWVTRLITVTSCQLDVKYFPFDYQTCTLKFGSWAYSTPELHLIQGVEPFTTKYYTNSSEWDLHNIKQEVKAEMFKAAYTTLSIEYSLARKPLYYLFNVLVPCIILMGIILLSFSLPPGSGERVGITITILLAFTVFLHLVQGSLPTTSTSIPLLSIFYMIVMAESGCSLLTTCVVLIVYHRGTTKGVTRLPDWVRKHFLGNKFDEVSKYTFRNKYSLECIEKVDQICMPMSFRSSNGNKVSNAQEDLGSINLSSIYPEEMLKEVKVITSMIHEQNRQDEIEEEWHRLSLTLDKIFFWIFLIIFIITSLCILVPASYGSPAVEVL